MGFLVLSFSYHCVFNQEGLKKVSIHLAYNQEICFVLAF